MHDLLQDKGPLGLFLINIDFLAWIDSSVFAEYNAGAGFKKDLEHKAESPTNSGR